MPEKLLPYLKSLDKLNNSLIFIGEKDSVINCKKFIENYEYVKLNNQIIIDENSTHKFEKLNEYYSEIDDLINSIYL